MDQNIKQQVIERINGTTNVLVTVSANPSVDQLAACIGLTLVLNKLGKHATAVFSGKIPSTIEFLKPEETLEKNTDSLRDFIIALDKSKADKLRYKVEDEVVRIFITPYKTSINEKDLEFSQGDFNVDVVLALGVQKREDLDAAIVAHGRILHDATVISVMNGQSSDIGAMNWQDPQASSLCEMVVDLSETLQPDTFDAQQATALLTGIVAETARFSNAKTSPRTMSLSAKLMAAGANQQLVAESLQTKLNKSDAAGGNVQSTPAKPGEDKGTLHISHKDGEEEAPESPKKTDETTPPAPLPPEPPKEPTLQPPPPPVPPVMPPAPSASSAPAGPQISGVKTQTDSLSALQPATPEPPKVSSGSKMTFEPPLTGGTLTANSRPEDLEPTTDAMSLPNPVGGPMLSHNSAAQNVTPNTVLTNESLTKIEEDVASPHINSPANNSTNIDAARDAVAAAAAVQPDANPAPLAGVGAQPLGTSLQGPPAPQPATNVPSATDIISQVAPMNTPAAPPTTGTPASLIPPDPGLPPEQTGASSPATPPPPVPPPLMPPAV